MSSKLKDKLVQEFRAYESGLNGSSGAWIHNLRKRAFEEFEAKGFPTRKHEEWKYTNLSFLNKIDFELITGPSKPKVDPEGLDIFLFEDLKDNIHVVYNGYYMKSLSRKSDGAGEMIACSMDEAFEKYSDLIEKHFGKYIYNSKEAFTSLNTAFSKDGLFIYIPENVEIDKDIHLLFLNDTDQGNTFANPRNLIIAEKNSRARMIQTCYTYGENAGLVNVVTEAFVGQGASLGLYKIHNCSGKSYTFGSTNAWQEKDSRFTDILIALRGKFLRNSVNSRHNGEGCETNYFGLYIMGGEDFIDNRTMADHALPNCQSNENYRGIIDDSAHAVFNGKILVRQNAQNTVAFQSNKNILMSDGATVNTKPQLEIFADDVKCSHGATSGNLDKDALYYLYSRGVSKDKAKALLLNAFASEIIENIKISQLRNAIKKLVAKRLCFDDIYFCEILENRKYDIK